LSSTHHDCAYFKGATTFSSALSGTCEVLVALNAGVMQRFERVVALPNPKVLNFPCRSSAFSQSLDQVQ
jgi:hypothetical protein